jgi:hypothetical protein
MDKNEPVILVYDDGTVPAYYNMVNGKSVACSRVKEVDSTIPSPSYPPQM